MGNSISNCLYNCEFHYKGYLANYPDLVAAGIDTHEKALEHWNTCGKAEGRIFNSFGWRAYLLNYPDLIPAGIDNQAKAVEHFYNYGKSEGRTDILLNFNWKQYLLNYQELFEKRINSVHDVTENWLDESISNNRTCTYIDNTSTGNNVLIIPCHFKEYGFDILLNNLKHLLPSKISHLIIVYSIQQGYNFDIEDIKKYIDTITDINLIFIHDVENKRIDWGKIVLAHNYIKENIININRVFVINDSIIICSDVKIYINNFINNNHFEFIGC